MFFRWGAAVRAEEGGVGGGGSVRGGRDHRNARFATVGAFLSWTRSGKDLLDDHKPVSSGFAFNLLVVKELKA